MPTSTMLGSASASPILGGTSRSFSMSTFQRQMQSNADSQFFMEVIRANLSDDLLSPEQSSRLGPERRPCAGHCYIAVEALWHLADGRSRRWQTVSLRLPDGNTHWWIRTPEGEVLDPTAHQFATPPDYSAGTPRGLLTRQPSRRCRVLLDRVNAVLLRRGSSRSPSDPQTQQRH